MSSTIQAAGRCSAGQPRKSSSPGLNAGRSRNSNDPVGPGGRLVVGDDAAEDVRQDAGEEILEGKDAAERDVDAAHRDGDDGADLEQTAADGAKVPSQIAPMLENSAGWRKWGGPGGGPCFRCEIALVGRS